jgi:hypothetical protein
MYYNIPDFDPKIIGWIVAYSRKNYWKVREFMLMEDLIHEGFECLFICRQKYADRFENDQKKFINTVKLVFANHIPYLQNRNVRMGEEPWQRLSLIADHCNEDQELAFIEMLAGVDEDQIVREFIADAPDKIRRVLEAFFDQTSEVHQMLSRRLRWRLDGTRDTLNERLCKFVGLDPRSNDLYADIRSYLRSELA